MAEANMPITADQESWNEVSPGVDMIPMSPQLLWHGWESKDPAADAFEISWYVKPLPKETLLA